VMIPRLLLEAEGQPCPQCAESDGWPSKYRLSRWANSGNRTEVVRSVVERERRGKFELEAGNNERGVKLR
jgi:hypothetical protein